MNGNKATTTTTNIRSNATNDNQIKTTTPFKEKSKVILHGLVSKPEWNGKRGTVMKSSLTKDGRQAVLVHDGVNDKTVGIKLSNMTLEEKTKEERQEDFWTELQDLKDRIEDSNKSRHFSKNGCVKQYNATKTPIPKLKKLLAQAERHISLLPELDDGVLKPAHQRCALGLGICPYPSSPPSIMKLTAWNNLRHARASLSEALEAQDKYEEALPIYHELVDQGYNGRLEVWDHLGAWHTAMNNLALCYKRCGQFDKAIHWYQKGLEIVQQEDPFSDICKLMQDNLDEVMGADAAGPSSNPSNTRACWNCGADSKSDPNISLSKCSKCYELKIATPAMYCSQECLLEDWKKRHKRYHSILKDRKKFLETEMPNNGITKETLVEAEEILSSEEEASDSDKLVAEAVIARSQGNDKRAKKLYKRALNLQPNHYLAHLNFGVLLNDSYCFEQSIHHFIAAKESVDAIGEHRPLNKMEKEVWARSVGSIWASFVNYPECRLLPKPEWMLEPRKQQRVGERAVKFFRDYSEVWAMLGDALEQQGKARAVECFQHASDASNIKANQERYQRKANNISERLGLL